MTPLDFSGYGFRCQLAHSRAQFCPRIYNRPSSCRSRSSRVQSHPEENAKSEGDSALQEELVRQLTKSMGKQRLIEAARKSMEQAKRERLKSKLEDAKEDVEQYKKLRMDRSKLEFDSLQADVNKAADDFDEILRKSRAEMENDKAEFQAFEKMVEEDQNRHLFFRGLYKREQQKKQAQSKGRSQSKDTAHRAKSMSHSIRKQSTAREKVMRVELAIRMVVYGLTAFNLSALVVTDILSKDHPSILDAVVGFCAAVLAWYVWSERQRLSSENIW